LGTITSAGCKIPSILNFARSIVHKLHFNKNETGYNGELNNLYYRIKEDKLNSLTVSEHAVQFLNFLLTGKIIW